MSTMEECIYVSPKNNTECPKKQKIGSDFPVTTGTNT